ncbi:MAG: PBP1A family penicillin-binding protein [Geminicoccaceae bacterium]|nr:PBP1A family penicillin-binding protein [Geminicoccaceae bacterium]
MSTGERSVISDGGSAIETVSTGMARDRSGRRSKPRGGGTASKTRSSSGTGIFRRLIGLIPALMVLGLVLWVAIFYWVGPDLPDTNELFKNARQARVTVLAADGSIVTERGAVGPDYVRLDEISPYVEAAVIATEDRRFYSHFGLDLFGTARALVANLGAGGVVAGGSTITQQLAKNLYLTPERSLTRKLKELVLALWLEARLTKQQILEVYLNRVYLGAGAYGVQAAAERYFAKNAADLTLAESAMIAGLLKAPSRYAPTNDLALSRAREKTVLNGMVETGMIDRAQADAAASQTVTISARGGADFAGYFVDYVLDGLTQYLGKPDRDWIVSTTLDRRLQLAADRAVADRLAGHPELQAAVVLLDDHGAVRAMVGGRTYRGDGFNRAISPRQPGSAFKPFVYMAAMDKGLHAQSRVEDAPIRIGKWQPRNSGNKYYGEVTLETAFARSLNTAAVRLSEGAGVDRVIAKARQFGIQSELRPVASIALGTSEVTPLELTAAYLPFDSGGIRHPSFAVERVMDASADLLYSYVPAEVKVIGEPQLSEMRELLKAVVVDGTGRAAALAGRQAFGKTGTTSDARDAWFVGFAGDYVAGVWVGRDDNSAMHGVSGANLPAQIWHDVMTATPRDAPEAPLPVVRPAPMDGEEPLSTVLAKRGLDTLLNWIGEKIDQITR